MGRVGIRAALAALTLVALLAIPGSSRASGCSITWVGDVDGSWFGRIGETNTNWSDNTLPDAGDHVCLDNLGAPYTVTLPANLSATVDHYSVASQATLVVAGANTLQAKANSTNAGTIKLDGGASSLVSANGNAADTETLTNTGTISVPAGGSAGFRLIAGDVLNSGTISIAHPEARLEQSGESRTPKLTNTGTLTVASGGAFANLGSTLVQGVGGTIDGQGEITSTGRLLLLGGQIVAPIDINLNGATLEAPAGSNATGNVDANAGRGGLSPLAGTSFLAGTVPAGITIDIDGGGGGFAAELRANTDATNAGTIKLNGGASSLVSANGNAADTETLTNTGTISVPAGGSAGFRLIAGDVLNSGTISIGNGEATFQASVEFRNPKLTNNGTLAVTGALRMLESTLVQGTGTISGPGPIDLGGGSPESLLEVRGGQIAASGDVNVGSSSDLAFVAAAGATGSIDVVTASSEHALSGDVPAGISIDIEESATLRAAAPVTNAGTITLLGAGAALRGTTIANPGTIRSSPGTGGSRAVGGALTSSGTVDLDSDVAFGGPVTSSGTFTVAASRTASSPAAYTQTSGTTTIDGTLAPSITNVDGGLLQGTGTVRGNLRNAGEVSPGPGVGSLRVTGTYVQTAAGQLTVRVDAPSRDLLDVTGAAALDGRLAISTGAAPSQGQTFQVLKAASRTGQFATTTGVSSGPYDVRYDSDGVTLVTTSNQNLPALSIDDVSVSEGNAGTTTATFTARLSAAATTPVTVRFTTANGTARAPGDFEQGTGTVAFSPGQVDQPVVVMVKGDATPEPDETFSVTLIDAEGARLADDTGVGTILNDDLALNSITPAEGGDGGTVTITANGLGLSAGATLRLSRAGQADIVATNVQPAADARSLTAVVDLQGKARGIWDVTVTLPGGRGTRTLPGAFTIAPTRAPDVRVDIVGQTAFRAGRPYTFFLSYSNLGNVDAKAAVIGVAGIPSDVTVELSPDIPLPPLPGGLGVTPPRVLPTTIGSRYVPFVVDVPAGGGTQFVRFTLSPPLDSFVMRAFELEFVPQGSGAPDPRPTSRAAGRTARALEDLAGIAVQDRAAVGEAFNVAIDRAAQDNFVTRVGTSLFGGQAGSGGNCVDSSRDRGNAIFDASKRTGSPLAGWDVVTIGNASKVHYMNLIISPDKQRQYLIDTYYRPALIPMQQFGPRQYFIGDTVRSATQFDYGAFGLYEVNPENPLHIDETECPLPDGPPPTPIRRVQSSDPNDKVGPAGAGDARHVSGDPRMPYTINFENLATATAPAQEVRITDQLDTSTFDLSTFSLGPVSFGRSVVLTPPAGLTSWVTEVDLRPAKNLIARVEAGLDAVTGLVTWRFTSLDPATGLPTDDALAGFLPPNQTPPQGQGSVSFSVKPRAALATGTEVRNGASIIFDENAPILTPVWRNTIDNDAPTSRVTSVQPGAGSSCTNLEVQWSAADSGSGVRRVDVFVSDNDGPYRLEAARTAGTSETLSGQAGHRYRFYAVARDDAGNAERAPATPDAVLAVAQSCPSTGPAPAPSPAGSGSAPAALPDRLAPTVTVSLTNKRFRIGGNRTPTTAVAAAPKRRRRAPVGTTFRITLSEPATFTVRISRATTGAKSGKRCVKRSKRSRMAKKCKLLTPAVTLTRRGGKKGRNDMKFSGRSGRKGLARGSYRAEITATDVAGNISKPRRVGFTIVRR